MLIASFRDSCFLNEAGLAETDESKHSRWSSKDVLSTVRILISCMVFPILCVVECTVCMRLISATCALHCCMILMRQDLTLFLTGHVMRWRSISTVLTCLSQVPCVTAAQDNATAQSWPASPASSQVAFQLDCIGFDIRFPRIQVQLRWPVRHHWQVLQMFLCCPIPKAYEHTPAYWPAVWTSFT